MAPEKCNTCDSIIFEAKMNLDKSLLEYTCKHCRAVIQKKKIDCRLKIPEGATIEVDDSPLIIEDTKIEWLDHPPHYTQGRTFEPWDVIEDWGLNYFLGNALKYISRSGRKNSSIEDMEKAIRYLNKEIENERNRNKESN